MANNHKCYFWFQKFQISYKLHCAALFTIYIYLVFMYYYFFYYKKYIRNTKNFWIQQYELVFVKYLY